MSHDHGAAEFTDFRDAAEGAGLTYVSEQSRGVTRRRSGKGFAYRTHGGAAVTDAAVLARIRSLAIPPAWTDVWICADPRGHLQAVGRDVKGRRQYRYHPKFRAARDGAKYEHVLEFATSLPAIRAAVDADLRRHGLAREKILAVVVRLLETTMIRVGNAAYERENGSYGLTTLRNRHISIEGADLKFHFKGKSGKMWRLSLHDRRIAKVVRACQDLPGQHLFQYLDEEGELRQVNSSDVNAYLNAITGRDVTAKDFRTWTGTVLAALALAECGPCASSSETKASIVAIIAEVAARLGNTPAICRKCYVHPEVLDGYLNGVLELDIPNLGADTEPSSTTELTPHEAAVLAWLKTRSTVSAAKAA